MKHRGFAVLVLVAAGLVGACSGQTLAGPTDTGESASDLAPAAAASASQAPPEGEGVSGVTSEAAADPPGEALPRPRSQAITVLRASGKAAPDFALTLLNGETFRLSEHRGKLVVVNFWGSWCPPCRWEMPDFQQFHEDYRDNGVVVVGVAVPPDDEADARAFVDKIGVTYPVGLDPEGELLIKYRVTSFPTTYLIDRDGIEERKFGIANKAVLRLFLKSQLPEG